MSSSSKSSRGSSPISSEFEVIDDATLLTDFSDAEGDQRVGPRTQSPIEKIVEPTVPEVVNDLDTTPSDLSVIESLELPPKGLPVMDELNKLMDDMVEKMEKGMEMKKKEDNESDGEVMSDGEKELKDGGEEPKNPIERFGKEVANMKRELTNANLHVKPVVPLPEEEDSSIPLGYSNAAFQWMLAETVRRMDGGEVTEQDEDPMKKFLESMTRKEEDAYESDLDDYEEDVGDIPPYYISLSGILKLMKDGRIRRDDANLSQLIDMAKDLEEENRTLRGDMKQPAFGEKVTLSRMTNSWDEEEEEDEEEVSKTSLLESAEEVVEAQFEQGQKTEPSEESAEIPAVPEPKLSESIKLENPSDDEDIWGGDMEIPKTPEEIRKDNEAHAARVKEIRDRNAAMKIEQEELKASGTMSEAVKLAIYQGTYKYKFDIEQEEKRLAALHASMPPQPERAPSPVYSQISDADDEEFPEDQYRPAGLQMGVPEFRFPQAAPAQAHLLRNQPQQQNFHNRQYSPQDARRNPLANGYGNGYGNRNNCRNVTPRRSPSPRNNGFGNGYNNRNRNQARRYSPSPVRRYDTPVYNRYQGNYGNGNYNNQAHCSSSYRRTPSLRRSPSPIYRQNNWNQNRRSPSPPQNRRFQGGYQGENYRGYNRSPIRRQSPARRQSPVRRQSPLRRQSPARYQAPLRRQSPPPVARFQGQNRNYGRPTEQDRMRQARLNRGLEYDDLRTEYNMGHGMERTNSCRRLVANSFVAHNGRVCVFCRGAHEHDACPRVPDFLDRLEQIEEEGRCPICLKKRCTCSVSPYRCRYCHRLREGLHNPALCPYVETRFQ